MGCSPWGRTELETTEWLSSSSSNNTQNTSCSTENWISRVQHWFRAVCLIAPDPSRNKSGIIPGFFLIILNTYFGSSLPPSPINPGASPVANMWLNKRTFCLDTHTVCMNSVTKGAFHIKKVSWQNCRSDYPLPSQFQILGELKQSHNLITQEIWKWCFWMSNKIDIHPPSHF